MLKRFSFSIFTILILLTITSIAFGQGPWITEWYALDPVKGTAGIENGRVTDWLKEIFGKTESEIALRAPDPSIKGKRTIKGEEGSTDYANGKYTLKAGGADIWGTADAFRFVYKKISGDFEIILKAESLDKTNDWSKIGPMVRQSNAPGSQYLFMLARGADGNKYFQERMAENGSATGNGGSAEDQTKFPIWLKIKRSGNNFLGSWSLDGKAWKDLNTTTLALKDPVLVGIAITSHSSGVIATGVVTNLTINGVEPNFADMTSEDIGIIKSTTEELGWAVRKITDVNDSNNISYQIYEKKWGDMSNFVFYGIVGVISPKDQETNLNLAQDDDARVWIGGKMVIESIGWTGGATTTKPFKVQLKKGMNAMMVKVAEGGGGDYVNARFDATDLTFTPKDGVFNYLTSVSPAGKLSSTWGDIKKK
ncbi:TPA: hypothetical protein ENX78_04605 [Candidatus Poribacteria bacterium]|nr:hypothetical protein [Candidatus Poribacteria bacterium]